MTPPDLVDSHCHLDFPDLIGDLPGVIARAHAAGVTRMVTICTRTASLPAVRGIAETWPSVWFAYGIHPMHAHAEPPLTVDDLAAAARHPRMVGIGESGLDYHYTAETKPIQQASLRVHCAAAHATGLPLIIHARDADEDMARILADEHRNAPFSCVMHCFSSGAGLARAALDLGFYLSMSGITAFPRSDDLRAIFRAAPLDRILLETDSPYLAPPPHRGRRNEPAYAAHTAAAAAQTFGLPLADFARITSANFDRLFPRAARTAAAA
jgi:TatD DNase family protein